MTTDRADSNGLFFGLRKYAKRRKDTKKDIAGRNIYIYKVTQKSQKSQKGYCGRNIIIIGNNIEVDPKGLAGVCDPLYLSL